MGTEEHINAHYKTQAQLYLSLMQAVRNSPALIEACPRLLLPGLPHCIPFCCPGFCLHYEEYCSVLCCGAAKCVWLPKSRSSPNLLPQLSHHHTAGDWEQGWLLWLLGTGRPGGVRWYLAMLSFQELPLRVEINSQLVCPHTLLDMCVHMLHQGLTYLLYFVLTGHANRMRRVLVSQKSRPKFRALFCLL